MINLRNRTALALDQVRQPGSIDRLLRRVFVWNGDHVEGCCYHGAFCCLVCGPAANFLSIPLLGWFFLLSGGGLIVRGIFLARLTASNLRYAI